MSTAAPRQTRLAGEVVLRGPASVTAATAALCAVLLAGLLLAALIQLPRERTLGGFLESDGAGVRAVLVMPAADAALLTPGQAVTLILPAFAGAQQDALTGIVEPGAAAPEGQAVRVALRLERQTMRVGGADIPLPPATLVSARVTLGRASLLSLVAGSVYRGPAA